MRTKQPDNRFGKWLRARRLDLGLTQAELGERIDRTGQAISAYECGTVRSTSGRKIRLDVSVVDALARALQAPINEAREAAGYAPVLKSSQPSPAVVQATRYLEDLPTDDQEGLLAQIKALHERRSQQQPREESPLFLQENTDTERN